MNERVIVLTGASGGIGSAIAGQFAHEAEAWHQKHAQNTRLVLSGRRVDKLNALAVELNSPLVHTEVKTADTSDPEALRSLIEFAGGFTGKISSLICNAGSSAAKPFLELSADEFENTIRNNLSANFHLSQAAHPYLRSGGTIVAISSQAAKYPTPLGAYSASKAGLSIMMKQLAYEWGGDGIRVNVVSPGMILTELSPSFRNPELHAQRNSRIPLGQHGTPKQIAEVVSFFAGEQSGYITGQDILVDGGIEPALYPLMLGI
ncbi:MAG: SDR family NAD(P)-dependent oxidoreductase [Microbacteriaceae bacterium]